MGLDALGVFIPLFIGTIFALRRVVDLFIQLGSALFRLFRVALVLRKSGLYLRASTFSFMVIIRNSAASSPEPEESRGSDFIPSAFMFIRNSIGQSRDVFELVEVFVEAVYLVYFPIFHGVIRESIVHPEVDEPRFLNGCFIDLTRYSRY